MNPSAHPWSRRLVWCALACFCVALIAPAMNAGNLRGQPTDFPGWIVMPVSLLLGVGALADFVSEGARIPWAQVAAGLAALLNLNHGVAGVWLYRGCAPGRLADYLGVALPCGLILAIVSPLALDDGARLLPGFYVWLLAQGLLLAAAGISWKAARTRNTGY